MSFDDCGFLISNIQLLCDAKFGHQETRYLFHQKNVKIYASISMMKSKIFVKNKINTRTYH